MFGMILKYLKERKNSALIFLGFSAVFAGSFLLYRLPVKAALYPAAICIAAATVLAAADFYRFKELHKRLETLKTFSGREIEALPESGSLIIRDYSDIIFGLKDEIIEIENRDSERYREMIDYYTVWAHQIKTPIAAMRLTLQSEDTPLSRRLTTDLMRTESYVEMVLAYLRLDSSDTDYVFKEQELDAIIGSVIKKFAPEFIDRKLSLDYRKTGEKIVTDQKWMEFLLEQIISNALKYTREGKISVRMEPGHILTVEDTGIGIDAQDLPRIFEKGFTGLNGRAEKHASGLGLYLCRQTAKNLGIGISAESEPGKGTKIRLDLGTPEERWE